MPTKGTRRRAIRVDDELWAAALAKAAENGEDVSTAIRRYLKRYVAGVGRPRKRKG
jgi:Arc/MetJ family transcription regulator